MTLEELADTLPNGFHDAEVRQLKIDYVKREVRLLLDLCVGDPSAETEELREGYRQAEVKLSGLLYWVIEPPDARYAYGKAGTLWIDAGALESDEPQLSVKLPESLPSGAFASWIFVQDWNSFMHVAAMDASIKWKDQVHVQTRKQE